jgi:hypothetical protein
MSDDKDAKARIEAITRQMFEIAGMSLSDMHKRVMDLTDPMRLVRRAAQQDCYNSEQKSVKK